MKGRDKPRREAKKPPKAKPFDKSIGDRRETLVVSDDPPARNIEHINGVSVFDDEDDGA